MTGEPVELMGGNGRAVLWGVETGDLNVNLVSWPEGDVRLCASTSRPARHLDTLSIGHGTWHRSRSGWSGWQSVHDTARSHEYAG